MTQPGMVDEHGLVRQPMTICSSSPRRCIAVIVLRCPACGWWGHEPEPGETLDLFVTPEHVAGDAECRHRQTDPGYRRRDDNARLVAAGLPPLPQPNGPPAGST